ncbi:hypothetical protein FHY13_003601 [Xanthomonas arboricola]|uniref:Uncharacterized protein n=1 Tax=Xanthomonas euroxanthea TaxID=2259622 RepID=A0AA46C7M2_9XANT|nr:hypothetical protein [Xanthomonas euroxanthea]NIK07278.1 hypothetical protein [Xanthomonas euroxanthea]SUZ27915.1 hypothetical protein CPBF424_17110 [Xanthomonas euroxanthea]
MNPSGQTVSFPMAEAANEQVETSFVQRQRCRPHRCPGRIASQLLLGFSPLFR